MADPVFYDPRRARWKRLRRLFDVVAVSFSLLVVFFVYTALRDEPLPEMFFSPQKRTFKPVKETEKEKARDRQKKQASRRRRSKLAPSQVTLNQQEGIRAAFYVPWDAASFSSLRDFAHQIERSEQRNSVLYQRSKCPRKLRVITIPNYAAITRNL